VVLARRLDGSAPDYANPDYTEEPVEIKHVEDPAFLADAQTMSLFAEHEPAQLTLSTVTTTKKPTAPAPPARARIPLADFDDWIEFTEALVGRADIPDGALFSNFTTLDELGEYENDLVALTGMDQPYRLADRFPWLQTAVRIADEQGFFHWELDFAQAFARGGFDLQVGNPPWVRPDWDEGGALAEHDPWFALFGDLDAWKERKSALLSTSQKHYIAELESAVGVSSFLSAPALYSELRGTQPNLYRLFIIQAWRHARPVGTSGMIHYDTHFSGIPEAQFRSEVYPRLRLHAHFQNRRLIFPDIDWNKQFSVNVYGSRRAIRFTHLSWLFDPDTLMHSLEHGGEGVPPTVKLNGAWDLRPHSTRLVHVDDTILSDPNPRVSGESIFEPAWRSFSG
jgi:hypothetical protein